MTKYHKHDRYIIFDQLLVDIIDQVELWSPRQVTHLPPVWDLLFPLR